MGSIRKLRPQGDEMTVGYNYLGGGQARETDNGNGNAFVIDPRKEIGVLLTFHADGTLRLTAEPVGDAHADTVTIWEGKIDRANGGPIEVSPRHRPIDPEDLIMPSPEEARELAAQLAAELGRTIHVSSTAGPVKAAPPAAGLPDYNPAPFLIGIPGWAIEDARKEAQTFANQQCKAAYIYRVPSAEGYFIDFTPRYGNIDPPVESFEPTPAADPLLLFRQLPPGVALFDRASGQAVGTFEGIADGGMVAMKSRATGHTVYLSGLSVSVSQDSPY